MDMLCNLKFEVMDLISLYLKIATDIQVIKLLKIMKCWHVGRFPKDKELDTPFQYEKGTCFIKAEGDKVLVYLFDSTIFSTQTDWNNRAQPLSSDSFLLLFNAWIQIF